MTKKAPKTKRCVLTAYGGVRRIFTPAVEPRPAEVHAMLNEIHIDRNAVTLGEVLIEG